MLEFYKGKLFYVLFVFLKTAPILALASIGFRLLFIIIQVASIWFIFGWVSGQVNPYAAQFIGLPAESYVYPCIGALTFFGSTIFSLLSKICGLKATFKFEKLITEKINEVENSLTKGDLKNIVKLMIGVLDVGVPLLLIVVVSVLWILITPYTLILIALILLGGMWLLKKGVGFSAKRYRSAMPGNKLDEYLNSSEHQGFYKILLLPSYVTLVLMSVIAISIVLSLIATKLYFTAQGEQIGYMAILTGVAFLQMRSLSSIIVRAGAYNKSLASVYILLNPSKNRV